MQGVEVLDVIQQIKQKSQELEKMRHTLESLIKDNAEGLANKKVEYEKALARQVAILEDADEVIYEGKRYSVPKYAAARNRLAEGMIADEYGLPYYQAKYVKDIGTEMLRALIAEQSGWQSIFRKFDEV